MHHLDVVLRGLLKLEDVVAVHSQHVARILDLVLVHYQPRPADILAFRLTCSYTTTSILE